MRTPCFFSDANHAAVVLCIVPAEENTSGQNAWMVLPSYFLVLVTAARSRTRSIRAFVVSRLVGGACTSGGGHLSIRALSAGLE